MCGIVGLALRRDVPAAAAARFADGLASLRHRGPDAQGQWQDERVWLGHARLSIIDLSTLGNQPMHGTDERHALVYNGEVYNFRELAATLKLENLRSSSDTEVVLRLFARDGVQSLRALNGMFAFAVLDRVARRLWLVRDRLGIKPLFYSIDAAGLAFASEIKAIHALRGTTPRCRIESLHEWLYYGNPLGGRTLHEGIAQLPPGHYLELDLDTFEHRVVEYWSLPDAARAAPPPPADDRELVAHTRSLLERAVQRQLVADVPVGLFLSGGVDSSALAAFASRHLPGRLATFAAGFDFEDGEGERPRARRVAAAFGTDHHEILIRGGDIGTLIEELVAHHDMPFGDAANLPLTLMARELGGRIKVVLQGDGGDELFLGYSRYFTMAHRATLRLAAAVLLPLQALTPRRAFHYRARRYLRALRASTPESMALLLTPEDRSLAPERVFAAPLAARLAGHDPFARHREVLARLAGFDALNQMSFMDLLITLPDTFLEKVDRATMAASLEVRVPFLDHDLVDFAIGLPGARKAPRGQRKALLKAALAGIVPDEVLTGPKSGLTVPYARWLEGPLRECFFDHLERFTRRHAGVLDAGHLRRLYAATFGGGRDDATMLWKILNFMIWTNNSNVEFA
ncbi:MAG TPA: asparagine synthase (glutamine-hydrolyzing) [Steroidobacteraceae bacterium]|nr:asparagine synthase (glutamine-hydrolyzing) [Steroidobacteraceae bacterium]